MRFEKGLRLAGVLAVSLVGACTARTTESAQTSQMPASPAPNQLASANSAPASRGGREARFVGAGITCERAVEVIKNRCEPLVRRHRILPQNCSIHSDPQVWIGSVTENLGKRTFISYVASPLALEWFVSEDGRWWTVNGAAKDACPSIAEFLDYRRERGIAAAEKRGNDAKNYEGVYDQHGNWKFSDCSEFEIKVANVVQDELFKNPDEDEERSLKRAAKKVGLARKVASDIYAKATSQCQYSLGKGR